MLISVFIRGWMKMPNYNCTCLKHSDSFIFTSVIVACKNEDICLPKLIECIVRQRFTNFELILVNDNSVDSTRAIMIDASLKYSNVKYKDSRGFGKKNAIREGIEIATGNFIVTTDADCNMSPEWLNTIVSYQSKYNCDLIICPVILSKDTSLFTKLQYLEFVTLVASGAGASGNNMPIMCNGANLAFKKNAWVESQADLREDILSGDDVFLLQSIKKRKGTTRFLKSVNAIVVAKHSKSIGEFITQRQRWASKSTAYTDWHLIFTSCVVFSISLLILILFSSSFVSIKYFFLLCYVVLFKYLVDLFFIYKIQLFFKIEKPIVYSLMLSAFHPFYIVFISFSSLFTRNIKWK